MAEHEIPQTGRFVWHDYMATEPERALAFYTELFGWRVHEVDMQGTPYRMLYAGEEGIGGVVPFDASHGPSHWVPYVATDDVAATAQAAVAGGGTSCVPPTSIPGVGEFAVVTGPTGEVFSPFRSDHEYSAESAEPAPANPGTFCWDELLTTDRERSAAFYAGLFGLRAEEMEMPPAGVMTFLFRGPKGGVSILPMPPDAEARPHWLGYVAVENLDESAQRLIDLGGTQHVPPTPIPDIGRFSVGSDPCGASIALFSP